jgi:hypothetical protein
MNEQNLDYLKNNIKYLGLGDKLYPDLEKNLREGKPEFKLQTANTFNAAALQATLHFRKYDAKLQQPGMADKEQIFYLDKGKGVTAKEAYNLLDGRSVYKELTSKEGQTYNAWQKLDFDHKDERGNFKVNQYHENYGYNLEAALKNLPLADKGEVLEAQLIKALQKGNLQLVNVLEGATKIQIHLAANPQFKTLDLFDSNMKPLSRDQKQALQIEPEGKVHSKAGKSEGKELDLKVVQEVKAELKAGTKEQVKPENGQTEKKAGKSKSFSEDSGAEPSQKKNKAERIKNLLPQKESTGKKRGLSI